MIKSLRGILLESDYSQVEIDVCGVGYGVGISASTAVALPPVGEEVRLYTYLQVRDDAMQLYGFATKEERSVFERLIGVSGIGPKMALSVLSTFKPEELTQVIMNEDDKRMSSVPGVGKKTAQRIILELKGAFEKDPLFRQLVVGESLEGSEPAMEIHGGMQAATDALLSMGFTPQECELALKGYDGNVDDLSRVISYALKRLGSA